MSLNNFRKGISDNLFKWKSLLNHALLYYIFFDSQFYMPIASFKVLGKFWHFYNAMTNPEFLNDICPILGYNFWIIGIVEKWI